MKYKMLCETLSGNAVTKAFIGVIVGTYSRCDVSSPLFLFKQTMQV